MKRLLAFVLALSAVLCGCQYEPEPTKSTYSYEYETEVQETICQNEELETPDSSAFTSIGYRCSEKELWVTFRNSGVSYVYYGVAPEVWSAFKEADSKGSFFNEEIKGYYKYDHD